jgi:hypothetical protein
MTYTVVRQEYEVPCEHPACDVVHRPFYNNSYDEPRWVKLYDMNGNEVGSRWESRYHMKLRVEWVILLDGERVGDAHATKRAALAEAATKPTI